MNVWISAEGVGGAGGQGGYSPSYPGIGYAHAEAVLPHYPHAEYVLWSDHVVTPYVSDHTGSIWYDYYGYSSNYNEPYDPVVYPLSYYFAQGGTQQVSFTTILLGHLIAVGVGRHDARPTAPPEGRGG